MFGKNLTKTPAPAPKIVPPCDNERGRRFVLPSFTGGRIPCGGGYRIVRKALSGDGY